MVQVSATEKKHDKGTYWRFNTDQLERPVEANDPAEYWGQIYMPIKNLITETNIFPWMSVNISNSDVPF